MDRKEHWENTYERQAASAVSWFQSEPALSLQMLDAGGLGRSS
jgi:hypothetical protein